MGSKYDDETDQQKWFDDYDAPSTEYVQLELFESPARPEATVDTKGERLHGAVEDQRPVSGCNGEEAQK
jgi:hypothetical protein